MVDTNKVTRLYWSIILILLQAQQNALKTALHSRNTEPERHILFLAIRRTVADSHCRVCLIQLPFEMYKLSEAIPVALISNCNTAHFN